MVTNVQHMADLLCTYISEKTFNALCAEISLLDDVSNLIAYTVPLKFPYSLRISKTSRYDDISVSISVGTNDSVRGITNRKLFEYGYYRELLYDIASMRPMFHMMSLMEGGSRQNNCDIIQDHLSTYILKDCFTNINYIVDGLNYIPLSEGACFSLSLSVSLGDTDKYRFAIMNRKVTRIPGLVSQFRSIVYIDAPNLTRYDFIKNIAEKLTENAELELFDLFWILGFDGRTPPEDYEYIVKLKKHITLDDDFYMEKNSHHLFRYNTKANIRQFTKNGLEELPKDQIHNDFGESKNF